jgi:molybdopterin/thiamine biosynthesis adenylyltransferase
MALRSETTVDLSPQRVLVVGVGGLGCAALAALVDARIGQWILVDEDDVDETNLHRQVLFSETDVGRSKLQAAADTLIARGVPAESIELRSGRVLPDNARAWFRDVDLVLEGADNYATKFLVADACYLENKPVVHGAAVGWNATVFATLADGRPCYRCVFEDLPTGAVGNCDSIGVLGPVVGAAGALMADRALQVLTHTAERGVISTLSGKSGRLRDVIVRPRPSCPLCGAHPSVLDTAWERYSATYCAAVTNP